MKTNQTTTRPQRSSDPSSRAEESRDLHAHGEKSPGMTAPAASAGAPPQPNWSRYADSRLRQFWCR